ncbi:dihydrofolate reductase [Halolamina sp.]|jgi:dihydrofolate reductase|uniref:dihydrofolate reductase n=1 Tax=Halolamina sp. TaxID=1940283 RepID=UPI00356365CC
MQLVSIAAVAENCVIAADGGIPWDYPADKQFYNETIRGHPAIMGRNTFGGDPKEGATNIVLTRSVDDVGEGAVTAHSVEEAVEAAEATGAEVAYVIGGQGVYESFLDRLERIVITRIPGSYDGDRYFPELDDSEWKHDDEQVIGQGLRVVEYVRRD